MPSYGYSERIGAAVTRDTALKHPSEILLLGDCRAVLSGGATSSGTGFLPRYINVTGGDDVESVFGDYCAHSAGGNLLFADKHVAWYNWRQTKRTNMGGPIRFYSDEW